jgi:hypothetical protein
MSEQTATWLLEELYYSAYVNHDRLDDVAPGYEYVVQQLCDDIIRRTALTKPDERAAMNRAQARYFGTDDTEDSGSGN